MSWTIIGNIRGPKGDVGPTGADSTVPGPTGPPGPANSLIVGLVGSGDTAAATITGDAPNQTLNLSLPKGDRGDKGDPGGSAWVDITGKPATYPPTAHTHTASEMASGTLDIARIPTGNTATSVALGNDPRLSDSRPPTAHQHSGADITSGTVAYTRLPVGTTASTVAAGNDSRFTDTRTPTDNTVTSAKIVDGAIVNADINASAAIAKTKLATDVQTSLGLADTAVQPAALAAAQQVAINPQSGATYTLALTDANKAVEFSAACTVTIPTNASVALPVGTVIEVVQVGTGAVTLTAASGVTLNGKSGITAQWGVLVLRKRATDTWLAA